MTQPYEHTQRGLLWIVLMISFVGLIAVALVVGDPLLQILVLCLGVVFVLIGSMFARLTVRETEHALDVRFGPMPFAGTKVRYDEMLSLRRARSRFIDGWGIHWLPGSGWTFNLWGFDCVEIATDRRRLRIGTDDPDGLLQHLVARTGLDEALVS